MRSTLLDWEVELARWLKPFLDRLGHKARRRMCPLYVTGLIGPGDRKSHHFVAAGATRLVAMAANDGSDGEQQPNTLPCWPLQKCGSGNASSMGMGSADTGRPLDRIWYRSKCGNSRS
jgi:hypothetical protein